MEIIMMMVNTVSLLITNTFTFIIPFDPHNNLRI